MQDQIGLEEAVQRVTNAFNFGNSAAQLPANYFQIENDVKGGVIAIRQVFKSKAAAQAALRVWKPQFEKIRSGIILRAYTSAEPKFN